MRRARAVVFCGISATLRADGYREIDSDLRSTRNEVNDLSRLYDGDLLDNSLALADAVSAGASNSIANSMNFFCSSSMFWGIYGTHSEEIWILRHSPGDMVGEDRRYLKKATNGVHRVLCEIIPVLHEHTKHVVHHQHVTMDFYVILPVLLGRDLLKHRINGRRYRVLKTNQIVERHKIKLSSRGHPRLRSDGNLQIPRLLMTTRVDRESDSAAIT